MQEFINKLFFTIQFIFPRYFYLWKPGLVWLHIISDVLIALAYFVIFGLLVYFIHKRQNVRFNWLFLLFSTLIVACGTTPIMEVWTLWHPTYWLSGYIKLITAVISTGTALALLSLIPQAQAQLNPAQLEAANQALSSEITSRQQAEQELQESMALLRALYEVTTNPQLDLNKRFNKVLAVGCQYFGLNYGFLVQIEGDRYEILAIQTPNNSMAVGDIFDIRQNYCLETLQQSEPLWIEHANVSKWSHHPGDVRFQIETYFGMSILVKNNVQGVVCFCSLEPSQKQCRSVDKELLKLMAQWIGSELERQSAIESLAQLQHQNELILNSAGEGIYGIDLAERCTFINQAAARMLGYEPTELLGLNLHNITHHTYNNGDLYPIEQCPIYQAIQNGQSCHVDSEVFWRRDGISFPVEYTSYPLIDGEIIKGAVVTFSDITQRKQAEVALKHLNEELEIRVEQQTSALRESNRYLLLEVVERNRAALALRQSEERFRSLVEATSQIIWDTKTGGEFLTEQPSWSAFTGQSYDQLKGWGWLDAIHPEDQPHTVHVWSTSIANSTLYQVEHRLRRHDGEYRYMSVRAVPVLKRDGSIREWVGVHTDITQRKAAEEEIRKALLKEIELNDLKSRFITTTSHEFRTPLAIISLSAGLLKDYGQKWSPEKRLTHFERIQVAVKRMTQLLEDVLFIGQSEAEKLQFKPVFLELEKFCAELIEELQLSFGGQRQISFVNRCDRIIACLDEKLLRQILTNLLSNAIKYSPNGGTVELELSCGQESLVFQVKDQGIGIPLKDKQRLFDLFYRATNVDVIPGNGLGLAIIKKCVDLHSGQISLESEVGVGTTFTVTLPLRTPTPS